MKACPTLCDPMDYTVHVIFQDRILEPFHSPGDLPNPRIEPKSPASQVDSLPPEPPRKPKNTGMGTLSLLQAVFLTQEMELGPVLSTRPSSGLWLPPVATEGENPSWEPFPGPGL